MDGRRLLVERGLVPSAVATLTARAFDQLPFEAMAPTKVLLKRFFSAQRWTADDDEALADAVGPGAGWWDEPLDDQVALAFGWDSSRFRLRVASVAGSSPGAAGDPTPLLQPATHDPIGLSLEATFDGPIAPEATPNPRTLVFRTGPLHAGDSRSYRAGPGTLDDARVAELVASFPDIATVLVARDFVALTLRRPDRWEAILAPVLDAVTRLFPAPANDADAGPAPSPGPVHGGPAALAAVPPQGAAAPGASARGPGEVSRTSRLDRAWRELGGLRAGDPAGLAQIVAATSSLEPAFRQVAAGLLGDAPDDVSRRAWEVLAEDPSRAVRRATIDAVVDAGRGELRPLLERALGDGDAWVRWKALRGLTELGAGPSRSAVRTLIADPDFRVRLEAHAALGRED